MAAALNLLRALPLNPSIAHISDDEYFSHMVLDDLNLIIRDIREAHKTDSESAPQTTVANEPVSYTHLDVYKRQLW